MSPESLTRTPKQDIAERSSGNPADRTIIRVENVTVRYRLPLEPMASLKEYMIRRLKGRLGYREVRALQGVSLTVEQGDFVGVIGRNGAGKSTLLRLIARVLRPTEGRVWIKGRVVPLLELGAGFHPELTGRENTFLNAAILGWSQSEIRARFQEIVDFSGLDEFIDSPLRTYSSGMAARLGFAIATAWEPDILIIDEALAAGDEAFQLKCRSRLETYRSQGATIILVSHDSGGVKNQCNKALWLDNGVMKAFGPADQVVHLYRQEYHLDSPP